MKITGLFLNIKTAFYSKHIMFFISPCIVSKYIKNGSVEIKGFYKKVTKAIFRCVWFYNKSIRYIHYRLYIDNTLFDNLSI